LSGSIDVSPNPEALFTPIANIPKLSAVVDRPNAADAWLVAVVFLFAEKELLPDAIVPVPIAVALPAVPTPAFISPATF